MTQKGTDRPTVPALEKTGFQTKGDSSRVTEQPTPRRTDGTYDTLVGQLRASENITDLFKLATSDDFKNAAAALSPDALKRLRDEYNTIRTQMDGKVRLDTFEGQIVYLVGLDWWHSDKSFGRDTDGTDGITFHIKPENSDRVYRALTSAAALVSWANNLREPPTEKEPMRVQFSKVPVSDPKRRAEGQTKWQIKRLNMPHQRNIEGAPF